MHATMNIKFTLHYVCSTVLYKLFRWPGP